MLLIKFHVVRLCTIESGSSEADHSKYVAVPKTMAHLVSNVTFQESQIMRSGSELSVRDFCIF